LLGLSNLPLALINVDLLAELDKLSANQTTAQSSLKRDLRTLLGFREAGRHAEAWQLLASVNVRFSRQAEDFRELSERQRNTLTWLQENPIKAVGDTEIADSRSLSSFSGHRGAAKQQWSSL